jgi:hypothetical protein
MLNKYLLPSALAGAFVFAACADPGGGGGPSGAAGSSAGSGGTTQGAAGSGQAGGAGSSGGAVAGAAGSGGGRGGSTGGALGGSGGAGGGAAGGSGAAGGAGGGQGGRGGGTAGGSGTTGAAGAGGGGASGTSGSAGRGGTGGSGGRGGAAAAGRGGAAGGSAGGTSGSTGSAGTTGAGGACVRDQVMPSEVLFIGDSFIALNNSIPMAVEANARAAGSLGQNERYRNNAMSGTLLGNNQIPTQYNNGVSAGPVKVVLMNGGGNDCLQANNPSAAYSAAMTLFQTMAQRNTQSVVYFFYPDPFGMFATGNLKPCLDGLRPMMKSLCEGLTAPKCYFIDLRPGWTNNQTTDGIHPTPAGGKIVADQIWATMQQHCIAQ